MGAQVRRLRFVTAPLGNLFMTELLEGVANAAEQLGVATEMAPGFDGEDEGLVHVVIPHEWFETTPAEQWPSEDALARTVALCTEQPGTHWFARALEHARRCGAAMDISPMGAAVLRRSGLDAEHLPLGYVERWDAWGGVGSAERPIDVLFLGTLNPRRDRLLARYATTLWPWRSDLVIAGTGPKPAPGPDYLTGAAKHERLRNAKVLLSPGRQESPYFEWVRAIEAMSNGCVLVCDHPLGHAPLVSGRHFVSGSGESLALLSEHILLEPAYLEELRRTAYQDLREHLPMTRGVERLLDVAARLPEPRTTQPPTPAVDADAPPPAAPDDLAVAVQRLSLEVIALRRRVAHAEARVAGVAEPSVPKEVVRSPAYEAMVPRVSICIPCYADETRVDRAIASAAAQELRDIEVLVLDDGSPDTSLAVARAALERRPWLAAALLALPANAGLPRARNLLAAHARAPYVLMLDSDNELYPPAAARLAAALDEDPGAFFAYPTLEGRDEQGPAELLSYRAWDPGLLRGGNYIDALSLLRRETLLGLGGYTEDLRLYGWEDYELWLRAACSGHRGIHVPEILARYRLSDTSMRAVSDIEHASMFEVLRERYSGTLGSSPTLGP